MYANRTCLPGADDRFGPQVNDGCRGDFDFTLLFEQSILTIGPSALLLLVFPIRIRQLWQQSAKTLPTLLHKTKLIAILLYGCLQLALLILWSLPTTRKTRASVPSAALSFASALALLVLSTLEHRRSIRPSFLINVFLLFSALLDLAQARTLWLLNQNTGLAALFTASVGYKFLLLSLEAREKRAFLSQPYSTYSPEELGGVLNTGVFWWINSLMRKGYLRVLEVHELFQTDNTLSSAVIDQQIQEKWKHVKSKGYRRPLLWTIFSCFRRPLLTSIPPRIFAIAFKFSQPLLIRRAVSLMETPETPESRKVGYALVGATALIYIGYAVSTAQHERQTYRLMTMVRGGLVSFVYRATFHINASSVADSAAVTLMSTDIDRINAGFKFIGYLWAGPIEIVLAICFLEWQIGASCVAPVVIALGCTLVSFLIGKWAKDSQKEFIGAIQRRVAITSSSLSSIKAVKMLGLTERISTILHNLRCDELRYALPFRRNILFTAGVSNVSALCGPAITFILYVKTSGMSLNVVQAFTSLSLISLLSTPVSAIVQAIPMFTAALACIERIQSYVEAADHVDCRISTIEPRLDTLFGPIDDFSLGVELQDFPTSQISSSADISSHPLLVVKDASFRFSDQGPIILQDLNLEVKRGTLTMVIGRVGSGKSALLKALLGELHCTRGFVYSFGTQIAFCAQDTWLPNTTLRQIILGTSPYEPEWYEKVLRSCMLDQDVGRLPDYDLTTIGSKGASLSGGQKQRLALARAVYARRQLMLLDDVLSGLDSQTDRAVFQNVLGPEGLCTQHGMTVILATHSVQHLRSAQKIWILNDDGTISEDEPTQENRTKRDYSKIAEYNDGTTEDKNGISSEGTRPANAGSQQDEARADLTRQHGDLSLYLYFGKSMGWLNLTAFLLTVGLYAFGNDFQAVMLDWWSSSESSDPGAQTDMYMGLYAMLAVLAVVGIVSMISVTLLVAGPQASIKLHSILLTTVMKAPYAWFVSTDSGITLNRFSQDMSLIDMDLLISLVDTFAGSFMAIAELVLIVIGATYVAVAVPFILGALYLLQKYYLRTSRQLRLLDLEAKSPLYTHFTETLSGLMTVRAFGWQEEFVRRNHTVLDESQKPYYLLYCVQRWLTLVLNLIVAGIATLLIALATQMRDSTSSGALGVALFNTLNFSTTLGFLIPRWTELETSLGAVSRVKSFESNTPDENTEMESNIPPVNWPTHGKIEFDGVTSVYSASSTNEPILRNISLTIEPGQKVGVVGRTGSGKSSLLMTLFSMLDVTTGNVRVDGISLSTLQRQAVRSSFIAIPQEPVFIAGLTLQENIDLITSVSDGYALYVQETLQKVGLWDILAGNLHSPANKAPSLSQGQQQLFSLALALLRKASLGNMPHGILVLDEPSSSSDPVTEKLMMDLVDTEFHGWTVLTVAHRLATIKHCDMIIVLDKGVVVEKGSFAELIQRRGGAFTQLWAKQQQEQPASRD
ncbi:hypothetical protein ASPZODRAFT_152404 [Penicilliopsis zonata CBS 506.65]|uniref:ABC transporter n=1 Tax=Penicilliopsis zonata CBS 506.65 TaxID=1073090 RepID=A0A1L9SG07_9EURO|nr:hypothetical protein ASPZODRAFT_152404 [Penicilliopsis zonata CBS 506.65]OJJ46205.1 hypothetical protein ASPZODRAFT_152404 [Penicilliopsis zonata CBS 506.65]